MSGWQPKKGDRVRWRDHVGTVVDDYWAHRDRYSVLFDGDIASLDFGSSALVSIPTTQETGE